MLFVSNSFDTSKLFGVAKQFYNLQSINNGEPNCDPNSNNYQSYLYSFQGTNQLLKNVYYKIYVDVQTTLIEADFTINDNLISTNNNFLHVISNDSLYADTLHINGKLYYGIDIKGNDNLTRIFYNHTNGILRIKLQNNQIWLKQ